MILRYFLQCRHLRKQKSSRTDTRCLTYTSLELESSVGTQHAGPAIMRAAPLARRCSFQRAIFNRRVQPVNRTLMIRRLLRISIPRHILLVPLACAFHGSPARIYRNSLSPCQTRRVALLFSVSAVARPDRRTPCQFLPALLQ